MSTNPMDINVEETGMDDVHLVSSSTETTKILELLAASGAERSSTMSTSSSPLTVFTPAPGLVAKTTLQASWNGHPQATKVFINLCSHLNVPSAPVREDMPVSLGELREERDKAGTRCLAIDVCVHPSALTIARTDPSYLAFLVQLSAAWACEKMGFVLAPSFSYPKMASKGTITEQRVRFPKPSS